VFRLLPLSDEEKIAALQIHAAERGFNLSDEACRYLLQHASRDLPSLLSIVAELDHTSLSKQKPVTPAACCGRVLQNLT
jgi:DnaA family protein